MSAHMSVRDELRVAGSEFARALMEHQEKDAQGRLKRHRLILVLDEFPMLGRMPFFETMMGIDDHCLMRRISRNSFIKKVHYCSIKNTSGILLDRWPLERVQCMHAGLHIMIWICAIFWYHQ